MRGTGRGYGTSHEDTVRGSSGPPVRNTHGRPDCAQPRQISRRRTIHPSVNILCHRARDTGFGGMRPPRETRATAASTHATYTLVSPINRYLLEKEKRKEKERDRFFSFVFFFFVYLSLLFDDISDPRIQRGARLTTGRTNGRVLSMLVTMEEMRYNRGRRSKVIADRSTSPDRILKTDLCASL